MVLPKIKWLLAFSIAVVVALDIYTDTNPKSSVGFLSPESIETTPDKAVMDIDLHVL